MKTYFYNGPVLEFNKVIANHWTASTKAVSEKKARSNLEYQFKIQNGRIAQSKISIPGKIITIEGDD